jgi:hypothetical protein
LTIEDVSAVAAPATDGSDLPRRVLVLESSNCSNVPLAGSNGLPAQEHPSESVPSGLLKRRSQSGVAGKDGMAMQAQHGRINMT